MEVGEGVSPPENETDTEQTKRPLKIRVAIFYDGTLNNRVNIREREINSDIYQQNRDADDGPSSYDNGRTNIAIMEPHVKQVADGYDFCMKCYIEGQGTLDLEKDSFGGYALGGGVSGVAARANVGIQRAVNLINDNNIDSDEFFIQKLTLDVFGFSRGAATARYAIDVLFNGRIASHGGMIYYAYEPIHTRLGNFGYDIEASAVEVCFAGLYDTVLSYYGSQLFRSTSNVLQQKAVARAKKALHLAAADEHRSDFPLHNIKSAKSNGGEEYFLPGVHSDVGGSYNQANELELEAQSDEEQKVYMLTSKENWVIRKANRHELEQDRDYLVRQGWYKIEPEEQIWLEPRELQPFSRATAYQTLNNKLEVKRENIHSAYCNIPLKIMAEYARKPEVKLTINEKLEDRANIILGEEPDLQELEGIIKNYIASTNDSKADDWIGEQAALNTSQLKAIRNRHFHFSSKPGTGYSPRIRQGRRIRYVYDA